MNTEDINKNTAAPSVTIAPRSSGRGSQQSTINPQLLYVVTLTTHKDIRSYPCRSMESAIKLAERFIAGLSRHSRTATVDVTKPRPAAPQPEATPAPAAEPGAVAA